MTGIKNLGRQQLETRDLGDSLQFVLKPNPRWGNVAAGLVVIGGFTFAAWWRHSAILMVFTVIGLIGLVSNRLRGRERALRVNRAEVVAQGDLQNSSTGEMTISLSEITSMPGRQRWSLRREWMDTDVCRARRHRVAGTRDSRRHHGTISGISD